MATLVNYTCKSFIKLTPELDIQWRHQLHKMAPTLRDAIRRQISALFSALKCSFPTVLWEPCLCIMKKARSVKKMASEKDFTRFYTWNHRRPKLTFRESEELIIFIHISVTAVRVGTWPFILRGVWLHENRWEFERFIRRCMGNKISLIYNA